MSVDFRIRPLPNYPFWQNVIPFIDCHYHHPNLTTVVAWIGGHAITCCIYLEHFTNFPPSLLRPFPGFVETVLGQEVNRFQYLYAGLPALDGLQYVQGENWLGVA